MNKSKGIFSKKVPVGIFLACLFVTAALVYSLGHRMAMKKFNDIVSYTQEKQKMYSKLSEVDYNIRESYIGEIDDDKLIDGACSGYINGVNDQNCRFLSAADYKSYKDEIENLSGDVSVQVLDDDVAVVKCGHLGVGFFENFIDALNSLISSNMQKIAVDLRGVSGGVEEEVFKVLEYIAPEGDIVKTVDSSGKSEVVCSSSEKGVFAKFVVLTDKKTSGLAEVFTEALKNFCEAKHVGMTTAGNAVRGKSVVFSDNSAMIIPDAFYVVSGEKKFFKHGVMPDVDISVESLSEDELLEEVARCFEEE